MATIREVANLANVSASTVSRVLSGDTGFSVTEETRKSVFQAVKELGYVPYMNRQKKEGKKGNPDMTIGCIFSSMYGNEQVDPSHNRLLNLTEKYLNQENISLSFTVSEHEMENPSYFKQFSENPPDGIIFMVRANKDIYRKIRKVVPYAIGVNSYYPDIDNVTYSKERTMEQAVDYLLNKGKQHIAYIGGPGEFEGNLFTSRRFFGYKNTLEKHELYNEKYVKNCRWLIDRCYTQTKELLELSPMPDAIICGSDNIAFSVYRAIYEKGLRIPEDIMVVSGEELPISEFLTPTLTTFEIPRVHIVQIAVEMLLKRIHGYTDPPTEILFPAKLIVRESTQIAEPNS